MCKILPSVGLAKTTVRDKMQTKKGGGVLEAVTAAISSTSFLVSLLPIIGRIFQICQIDVY